MIDDRPAESIPLPVQEAIVKAVRDDGVGLFYAGGKGAYGTGGYFDTPVASILPVEMIQKEEKRDPSTTLVVIIDTSGSMTGERVQLAKECARLAIRRLLPHDKVGIVEFYGTKQWAAPIQSAANAIDIQRAINRMDAGGGTVILPAIEEAFYAMQNVQTRYKHVLVLTDGGVESGDFESLMRQMAAKGINVSTVLVGSDAHSEFLVNIANWGKGHFYSASSRFNIPEVLLKQPSTSKIPPYRPGSHLVSMGGPSGWWGEIPRPEEPQLSGYVETRLRPGAQVAVETETERHPVLASWRYGLGRVSAFTTEPVGEGTAPWREWDGYGAWLMRVLVPHRPRAPATLRLHHRAIPHRGPHRRPAPDPATRSPLGRARRCGRRGGSASSSSSARRMFSPRRFWQTPGKPSTSGPVRRTGPDAWPTWCRPPGTRWHRNTTSIPHSALDLALLASATGGSSVSLGEHFQTGSDHRAAREPRPIFIRLWPWCLILALAGVFRRSPVPPLARLAGGRSKKHGRLFGLLIGFGFASAPKRRPEISPALEAQLQRDAPGGSVPGR